MLKKPSAVVAAVAALAATAAPAWGQGEVTVGHSGWKWGNPQPQGNTLRTVEFAGGTGYAAGDFGTLLRTENGLAWTGLPTGLPGARIERLRVVDPNVVILSVGCVMRRSDDGGQTFRRVPFAAREVGCPSGVAAFHFPTANTGYLALGDGSVISTTDGGQAFGGKQPIPGTQVAGGESRPDDVFFVNDTTGFAIAGGSLYRTTDSAQSWVAKVNGTTRLRSIYFAEATTGYAVGDANTVLKTTDGGETWTPRPVQGDVPAGNLTKVRCASAQVCLISTESGDKVLRTTDGGATISAVDPSSRPVYAASFATATNAVGVGEFGTTVFSADAGSSTATPGFSGVGDRLGGTDGVTLSRLRAADGNVVSATGDRGRIGRSTDGGKTWATIPVPTAQAITDVSFPDATNGYSIDTADALRVTANAGGLWTPVDIGDAPSVNALLAVDRNTVNLFTDRGIYRSTSAADTSGGGTTFEAVDNAKVRRTTFSDFDRTDGAALYAFGPTSLWLSTDRGSSWKTVRGPVKKPRYQRVDFVSSRVGYALTTDGRVWFTRNGGRKWAELATTGTAAAYDMAFGDAKNGWLAIPSWAEGDNAGLVLRTSDGGASWRPQQLSSSVLTPSGLEAPVRAVGFALGNDDNRGADLFRTDNGGDQGDASTITLKPSVKRLAKAGRVRVTVQLSPGISGARVALLARSGKGSRWTVVQDGVTVGGGRLVVDTSVRATTRYVAQWQGDADRNGDGSPAVTVAVGKAKKK
jgi:photosystem II stability/assembly factor-like uncharacterized protein